MSEEMRKASPIYLNWVRKLLQYTELNKLLRGCYRVWNRRRIIRLPRYPSLGFPRIGVGSAMIGQ